MSSLAKKLGIRPGQAICLLNAASNALSLLRQEYSETVRFSNTLENEKYNIIIYWPVQLAELADRFAELQRHVGADGAVWVVIPKKQFARNRGIDFSWLDMQEAALRTGLVDNKVASLSDEEYATRFVVRKNRNDDHA